MQPRSSSNGKSASSKAANKSAPSMIDKENAEKKRLRKEIQELRCIIEKTKWSLEMLRFKDAEREIEPRDSKISHLGKVTNVEVQLQNDLYKFAGFHCVKFKRREIIFNFASINEQQKDTYAVQLFVKDAKGSLGKWVMPMSVDMNEILIKIPIDKLSNLTTFIKNCKHNINCYAVRQEQFLSLKKHILHMKHYALHSNTGYMQINLELYGVHDKEDDKYIDLIIYLLYHSDEARPYKVKVDTTTKKQLDNKTSQRLKVYLKEFKISDLQTAFNKVFMKKNSAIMWTPADNNESPLEINNTSISDEEGFLEQLQTERKKSLRRAKRRHELRIKWNQRKKQKDITKNIALSESNSNDDTHSETEAPIKTSHQPPINEKETEEITLSLKQQKQNNKNSLEATPMNKSKIKLKQTKLNFQATQSTSSANVNKGSLLQSKPHVKLGRKNQKAQLITSTPLHPRVSSKLVSTLEIDNITEIGSPPKKVTDNTNDLKNSSRSESESPKKKMQKIVRRSPRSTTLSSSTHSVKNDKPIARNIRVKNKIMRK